MSKATAIITDKFKNTYVVPRNNDESEEAQRAYFAMGFRFMSSGGDGRNAVEGFVSYVRVDGNGAMAYSDFDGSVPSWYGFIDPNPTQVSLSYLKSAAEEVRRIKRAESKAQKKRAAKRKWDATSVMHIGQDMPCDGHTLVTVRLKNGITSTGRAEEYDWGRRVAWAYEISSYKVLTPNKHKPKPVNVEKVDVDTMMSDVAGGLGKGVAKVETDKDGWIKWDGAGYKPSGLNYCEGEMHGPVLYGTKVDIRYRCGKEVFNISAGVGNGAGAAYWIDDGIGYDIVAYRLSPEVLTVDTLSMIGGEVGELTAGGIRQVGNPNWCVGCSPDNCSGCPDVPKGSAEFSKDGITLRDADGVARVQIGEEIQNTNPKKQYGVASIPLEMWPDLASAYGALGLYNGSLKYGKANYANTPVEASIYIAAARRHLAAWCAGEEFDPADGVPNLGGVLANIAILIEARAAGTLIDDRMLQSGYLKEREALKGHVKNLQAVHAGKNPKHFTREKQ